MTTWGYRESGDLFRCWGPLTRCFQDRRHLSQGNQRQGTLLSSTVEVRHHPAYAAEEVVMSDEDAEFEALLDKLGEELSREEEEIPTNAHRWETERAAAFAGEEERFQCGKCFARLQVAQDESLNQAMSRQDINPNCAEQLLVEVDSYVVFGVIFSRVIYDVLDSLLSYSC